MWYHKISQNIPLLKIKFYGTVYLLAVIFLIKEIHLKKTLKNNSGIYLNLQCGIGYIKLKKANKNYTAFFLKLLLQ